MSKIFEIQYKVVLKNEEIRKVHREGYDIIISDLVFAYTRLDTGTRCYYKLEDIPETQQVKGIIDLVIKELY